MMPYVAIYASGMPLGAWLASDAIYSSRHHPRTVAVLGGLLWPAVMGLLIAGLAMWARETTRDRMA